MTGLEDEIVAGKYRLTRLIGRGGMGSVWEGIHLTLGNKVAVKFLDPACAESPETRQRFENEARAAARINSKYAVQVYDHGLMPDGRPFIVMEFLTGEPLDCRLDRDGRIPAIDTAQILSQVCRALTRAHSVGIVHRDLKPENVFLVWDDEDNANIAKVVDFGIVKFTDKLEGIASSTRTGSVIGTPYYMSPEQARGLRSVDHRTDLWSLGVIAYQCIVGRRPFEGESVGDLLVKICTLPLPVPSEIAPGCPPAFDAWFARALQREPSERFATAQELAEELLRACSEGSPELPHFSGPSANASRIHQTRPPHTTSRNHESVSPPSRESFVRPVRRQTLLGKVAEYLEPRRDERFLDDAVLVALISQNLTNAQEIVAFLLEVFDGVQQVSPGVLELHGVKYPKASHYRYFAVLTAVPSEQGVLGGETFVAAAKPLESFLANLPKDDQKVVLALARFGELGKGFRENIRKYRKEFGALVVPIHVGQIASAHREKRLTELFKERIDSVYPTVDPFAPTERADPASLVGMHRQVTTLLDAVSKPKCVVLVSGLPCAGKSSLVDLADYSSYTDFVRIRCRPVHDYEHLVEAIACTLCVPQHALDMAAIFAHCSKQANRAPFVLVLEDADRFVTPLLDDKIPQADWVACSQFWHSIEAAVDGGLRLIVTGVRVRILGDHVVRGWANPLVDHRPTPVDVPPLDQQTMRRAVEEPAMANDIHFKPNALDELYRLTGGYVNVVRALCSEVVQHLERSREASGLERATVKKSDISRSAKKLSQEVGAFESTVSVLSAAEKDLLGFVASSPPKSIDHICGALLEFDRQVLVNALKQLTALHLVEHRNGRIQVVSPILQTWLKGILGKPRKPESRWTTTFFAAAAIVVGVILIALLFGADVVVSESKSASTCRIEVKHPNRIVPGEKFGLDVTLTFCNASSVTLMPDSTTRLEVAGRQEAIVPISLSCFGGKCAGSQVVSLPALSTTGYGVDVMVPNEEMLHVDIGFDLMGWSFAALGGPGRFATATLGLLAFLLVPRKPRTWLMRIIEQLRHPDTRS